MGFSPDFLDEVRQRLSLGDVIGRRVKLVRRGHEHTGLCPFHSEKTPSFTVNDFKGFYHCFGWGAHGDAFRFIMETEGLSFPEAVERLAGEAGLAVPAPDPRAQERSDQRAGLVEVMEAAADWFSQHLAATMGAGARDYLRRRGLDEAAIARFRLGFAPDRRSALKDGLIARGIAESRLIEGGLLIQPEDGGESYDRFRGRVMFPITDRRGRVVAFGGRTLGEARAKYLNSPETPLFHKGRLLYNLAGAREASRQAAGVLVVEGYMDVIALDQAGLCHVVAPLGTALTEDQLRELWRLSPEPVLCFDGDKAGLRAAHRAADRALELLKPGFSLRFAFLPEGQDPDSLLRSQGRAAFDQVVEAASPLIEVLWRGELGAGRTDTPEQRAGLEERLDALVRRIGDSRVRDYYRADFQGRLDELLGGLRRAAPTGRPGSQASHRMSYQTPRRASGELRRSSLARRQGAVSLERERLFVLAVLNHPDILERHGEEFATLEFMVDELDRLRGEIIHMAACHSDLDSRALKDQLQQKGWTITIERLERFGSAKAAWFAQAGTAAEDVDRGWQHLVSRHHRAALETQLKAAEAVLAEDPTEENFARLCALQAELARGEGDEATLDGYGVASGRDSA